MDPKYLQAMIKLMSHPETKDFMNDPSFMQKVQIIMKNPQMATSLLQSDPKLRKAFEVISSNTGPTDLDGLKKMFEGQDFSYQTADGKKHEAPKGEKYDEP